jgi:hypothetical protein
MPPFRALHPPDYPVTVAHGTPAHQALAAAPRLPTPPAHNAVGIAPAADDRADGAADRRVGCPVSCSSPPAGAC